MQTQHRGSYETSDWSPATTLRVASSPATMVGIMTRAISVKRVDNWWKDEYRVEFLYSPELREVWVGSPAEAYCLFDGKIQGLRNRGDQLRFKTSRTASKGESETDLLNHALQDFINNPDDWTLGGKVVGINLQFVLGWELLFPPFETRIISSTLKNLRVQVSGDSLTVLGNNWRDQLISMDFTPKHRVTRAAVDGRGLFLIDDGSMPRDNRFAISPTRSRLASDDGPKQVIKGATVHDFEGANGEKRSMSLKGIIHPETGGVWLGPDEATVVLVNERLVGFLIEGSSLDLAVYNQYATIATSGDTAANVQSVLKSFNESLISGTFKPSRTLNLRTALSGVADELTDVRVRSAKVDAGHVRILVSLAQKRVEIVLDSNYTILAVNEP